MRIDVTRDGQDLTLTLEGRLDAVTAPRLSEACAPELPHITQLTLDCARLHYVSSAGLRVLLTLHKALTGRGRLVLRHVPEDVREILDITGFVDVLDIE